MVAQKWLHYLRRMQAMGLRTAWWLISNRIKKQWFLWRHRHHWLPINPLDNGYPMGTPTAQPPLFCLAIRNDPLFRASLPSQFKSPESISHRADQAAKPCIELLGFGCFCFDKSIPWHSDVSTNQPSPTTWRTEFCSAITPRAGFDIKVPWELSRLQHFFSLGLGYRQAMQANDHARAATYAAAFVSQVTDWIDNNPYLVGVNWANPMEVAIRSINLTWAWALLHDASTMIPPTFWQRLSAVLHAHMRYLEHTWEVSDRPNNHYLADRVGHAYLKALFGTQKPQHHQATISQFLHQTNPNGTCYEGSTAYHRLDTELLLHYILLCKYTKQPVPTTLLNRYNAMQAFLGNCTDHSGNLAQIGDNDSGSIVTGLATSNVQSPTHPMVTTYKDFGLTIIKTPLWHITFRHPTYAAHQPTGHFHQDWLAITIGINGIPVFVDPGSYLYTSAPAVRNQFRSVASHNTFYPNDATLSAPDLFQLPRAPHTWTGTITQTAATITVTDNHYEYRSYGVTAHRTMQLDTVTNVLTIDDWWEPCGTQVNAIETTWAMLSSPMCSIQEQIISSIARKEINKTVRGECPRSGCIESTNSKSYLSRSWFDTRPEVAHSPRTESIHPNHNQKMSVFTITLAGKRIATVTTPFACAAQSAWFSPAYGRRQPATKLMAQTLWNFDKKRTEIRPI
jgi:hypothetical protein